MTTQKKSAPQRLTVEQLGRNSLVVRKLFAADNVDVATTGDDNRELISHRAAVTMCT